MNRLNADGLEAPERRVLSKVSDAQERQRQRRALDRRDSPRIPLKVWARFSHEGGSFEECEGNVGLGGAYLIGASHPQGSEVELAFWLPQTQEEIRTKGRVIRSAQVGARVGIHVQLDEMDVRTELSLARFLQSWAHNG